MSTFYSNQRKKRNQKFDFMLVSVFGSIGYYSGAFGTALLQHLAEDSAPFWPLLALRIRKHS